MLCLAWVCVGLAQASIVNVDTGGTYSTIQAALDAAGVGHTIQVGAGLYTENLSLNPAAAQAVTLRGVGSGSDPATNTVIQGVGANLDAIHIVHGGTAAGERVTLSDLRVTGGRGAGNLGMGVEIGCGGYDVSHITFHDVACVGNEGHGIGLNHTGSAGDILVSQCLLAENDGLGFRVPLSLGTLGTLTLSGTTVRDNASIGFLCYTAGTVAITDSVFSGNSSGEHTGGDIVLTQFADGVLTLDNVSITSDNAESAIRVSGSHDGGTPRLPVSGATISMTDVSIAGTQQQNGTYPSAAIVLSRFKDLGPGDVTFDNVSIDSTADHGLFIGTVTDSTIDLGGEVAFNGTFNQYAIALGQHGNSSKYAPATATVSAVGCGLTEADVSDGGTGDIVLLAPPVCDPGGPYWLCGDGPCCLDGSGSTDPDGPDPGGIVNYLWSVGALSVDAGTAAVCPLTWCELCSEFALPGNGQYTLTLTVTDDEGEVTSANTTLTLVPEPATLGLLALGAFALARRRRQA